MKIGFDAKRLFNNFTGLGNYSRSLVDGLNTFFPNNKYYLFTSKKQNTPDTKDFLNAKYKIITPQNNFKNIWRSATCTKDINSLELDIYHGLSNELPFGIKKTKVKSIVTIHDLIYKTYPNDFKYIDRKIYDYKFRYACNNADKIIAVSESTKKDIIDIYNISPKKIDVVYQSCHKIFKNSLTEETINKILRHYNIPNNFILYVGSIIKRKNLLGLVKAINKIKDQIDIPLVVIGKGKKYEQEIKTYISENKLEKLVIFSQVAYLDLPAIYQRASVFIYPSVYEGFGIPIIESLWSKTPVITTNTSSLPEAAGNSSYFCNTNDNNSIADGILKILNDKDIANKMIQDGLEYVQKFENKNNAKKLMDIYTNLLNNI